MTIAAYLVDKLFCPVCHRPAYLRGGESASGEDHKVWDVTCGGCDSEGPLRYSKIEAITLWLILTGPPIPTEVEPPRTRHTHPIEKRNREIIYESGVSTQGVDWEPRNMVEGITGWYLRADERNKPTISEWLGRKV